MATDTTTTTGDSTTEKTFTQEEVNAIVAKRVSAAKKGMPDETELAAFRTWKDTQQSETAAHQTVINERDTARNELKAAQDENETLKRQLYVLEKGLTGEDAEFVIFKAAKLVNEETTFEKAVEEVMKDRNPTQRVDFTAPLNGADGGKTTNSIMNAIIRNARR